ncbi:hypothetical protein AMS68_007039 [Peltaster fructicola]|uniref:Far11/STRP C-terminal domain-containing protein n=1 Tax=Peltaster fructicola TaxID=286661 RepID=A0A6H0Y3D1_9PEZI|nr:hypothetical protein AMS68_007039 [Peltaster fructicola]
MDEVENPALPAAGETSPTIRPVDAKEDGEVREQILPVLPSKPPRPGMKRESSANPPLQPPPAPPVMEDFPAEAPDSLTLADLKRIRETFPHTNPQVEKETLQDFGRVYNFEYQDAQSFPAELEEWFSYSKVEERRLKRCKAAFDLRWRTGKDWLSVTEDERRAYVEKLVAEIRAGLDPQEALQNLVYITLGVWEETAGQHEGYNIEELFTDCQRGGSRIKDYGSSTLQIQWILAMVDTLHSCGALPVIYKSLQQTCDVSFDSTSAESYTRNETPPKRGDETMELWCSLTLMYVLIEVARTSASPSGQALKNAILALEPNLLNCFTRIVARLRWDETAPVPLTKMLLLSWKAVLVSFGGIEDVETIKRSLREDSDEKDDRGQPIITASPLDYHLFRQEISSKYPAYNPPPPLFPLEPENNSILPPLKHRQPTPVVNEVVSATGPIVGTNSIIHQPIHIATPAPSPPPSPAAPGKAGKKQNYQTNQMFPFLYPPLEADSNALGGKGTTELQDALVGRKWEGADIPTSILEAAELFAKRMRATRAMKQLWTARVDFMKYERGWKSIGEDQDIDDEDFEILPAPSLDETAEQGRPLPSSGVQAKLAAVDKYYQDSLPYLQSVVIVLLKAVLHNVTDLVTRGGNSLQAGIQFTDSNGTANGAPKPAENGDAEESTEELDRLRSQEIAGKALSAILLLLLKWFKVNHILQYEYMSQLLLDSNYVPLVLKLWQTQEIGRACHMPLEREDSNFFYLCQMNSRKGAPQSKSFAIDDESEDEAAPPPIKLKRNSNQTSQQALPPPDMMHPPEIDELGYPLTLLPVTPIETYSYRNVFSAINYLRVLQKVTRRKTHRALLLVSYKSSNHLKKTLKIPVQQLRYYTLKLFKSQVPFCGRKWRQGNMKIITAVWLSVPAELRDDWLTGGGGGIGGAFLGDVDGTVDDALPLEQSLRALTHFWNIKTYPDMMGIDNKAGLLQEEVDFFQREIEKIEAVRAFMLGDEESFEEVTQQDAEAWQGPIEGY